MKNIKDDFRGIALNLQSALGGMDILSVLTLTNWMWRHTPVIPAPMGQRWSDCEFQASLGYIVRPDLKQKTKINKKGEISSINSCSSLINICSFVDFYF